MPRRPQALAGAPLWIALASIISTGCASPHAEPPSLGAMPVEDADRALTSAQAYPMLAGDASAGDRRFRITRGVEEGSTLVVRTSRTGDGAFEIVGALDGAETPESTRRVRAGDDGAIRVAERIDHERGMRTVFDPPIVLFPARLEPGVPVEQELELLVYRLDDPDEVDQRGEATNTLTLKGVQEIPGTDGARALVVRAVFTSDFGPAKVRRVTDRWFDAGGRGLVAESFDERVRVFGLETEKTIRTMTHR